MRQFNCVGALGCHALYRIIRVGARPEMVEREIACQACGGPLPAREGKFVLKYLMLREGWPYPEVEKAAD